MILYFDNYITNTPLIKDFYKELDKIRDSCNAYSTRDKFEITLYTLASYASYPWSKAIIVYSLEDKSRNKEFETEVKKLFPKGNLILMEGRSDTQKKYQEKAKIINSIKDDWIFYAGNNDHPFICSDFKVLDHCLKKADALSNKHKFVSILYSHFSEGYNMFRKGTAIHDLYYNRGKLLNEDAFSLTGIFEEGWNTAIQIVNKPLFNHWLFSKKLGDKIYRRIEEMAPEVPTKNQILIVPKEKICEHFDGYSHYSNRGYSMSSNIVPPLFIPSGFFKNDIKIRYGYDDYKEDWVNINPSKDKYSFEDQKNGTDLKITLSQLPLFWKERISKIDINKKANLSSLKEDYIKEFERYKLPFKSNKNKFYIFHILKYRFKILLFSSKIMHPIYQAYKKYSFLKKIHKKLNETFFGN